MAGSSVPGPPETTGQPIAPNDSQRAAPGPLAEPAPADLARRPASGQLVAIVVIALGFVVLLGGVGAIAVLAIRMRPAQTLAGLGAPSASVAAPRATPPSPKLPGSSAEAPPPLRAPAAEHLELRGAEPFAPPAAPAPRAAAPPTLGIEASASIPVTATRPIDGKANADITLSLFGDLTCPHTARTLRGLRQLRARHGDRLRFVFYHRPIEGEAARTLAREVVLTTLREGPGAGWAAVERGPSAGATSPKPATASEQIRVEAQLTDDERLAAVLDVRVTPTLFVNGTRLVGAPDDGELESALQSEQRAVGWLRAQGVAPERAYALRVRKNLIEVEDGAPDRACIPRGDAPELGPDDALVTLVEFSGFECGACRELEAAIGSVVGRHPNEVRRLFRGLAPAKPARARRVAAFALSAQSELGDPAFWSLYRALRAAPVGLDDAGLLSVAKRIGLDGERLLALAADDANERRLNLDLELAAALNVPSVPALFVNGRLLAKELSAEKLEAVVKEELSIARRIARGGTPPSRFDELLCRAQ